MSGRTWTLRVLDGLLREGAIRGPEVQSMGGGESEGRWEDIESLILEKSRELESTYLSGYLKGVERWIGEVVEV